MREPVSSPYRAGMERLIDAAGRDQRLGGLLKRCRLRIPASRESLGGFARLPVRFGKPVTQEEVAEAVGISRQWYAMLELDRPTRVSAPLLGRLGDALLMDGAERALLFRLAVPELRSVSLGDRQSSMAEAFGPLRTLVRRLWAATTESEALAIAREHASWLLAADAVSIRIADGRTVFDRADSPKGAVAVANVRSRRGLVAQLRATCAAGHEITELEREQLGTIAELTSLALAGASSPAA